MVNGWTVPSKEKKRKGKQHREREVKKHKELDDKEIDKIENRHEVNTKTEHGMAHDWNVQL